MKHLESSLAALFFSILLFGMPALAVYLILEETKHLSQLQSGEYTLVCNITGQYEAVHPSRIKDKVDDMYIFSNGYSKTCNILEIPYSE